MYTMATRQPITEFLTANGIKWFPIALDIHPKIKDGQEVIQYGEVKMEKILLPIAHGLYSNSRPKSTDFETLDNEMILQRQTLVRDGKRRKTFNTIAIDTREVYHIDFDVPIAELEARSKGIPDSQIELLIIKALYSCYWESEITLEDGREAICGYKLPFYKSATKSYGRHILIKGDEPITNKHPFKYLDVNGEVEILAGGWSYAPIDAVVEGYEDGINNIGISNAIKKLEELRRAPAPIKSIPTTTTTTTLTTSNISNISNLDCICKLSQLIDNKYLIPYDPWYKIVMSLKSYAIAHSTKEDEIRKIAINMSRGFNDSIDSYTDEGFDTVWNADVKGITIGTFHHYAKISNPEEYMNIMKSVRQNTMSSILICTANTEFAKVFYTLKGDKYMYSAEEMIGYYFNGVYWVKDKNNMILYADIRDTLAPLYQKAVDELTAQLKKEVEDYIVELHAEYEEETIEEVDTTLDLKIQMQIIKLNEKKKKQNMKRKADQEKVIAKKQKQMDNSLKKYDKVIDNLKAEQFLRKIVNDVITRCRRDKIEFDKQPWLFAFNDKIFDLKTGLEVAPNPAQLIATTTGYNWFESTNTERKSLQTIIKRIFPNKNERKLYMMILATGLIGDAIQKLFFLTGRGSNGKGLINDLMMSLCGSSRYGYIGSSSTLTQELKEGANPAVAAMHNKRFIVFQEANEGEQLQGGVVKKITGGGSINARTLFSAITDTKILATFVLEFNKRPRFNCSIDYAMTRRITLIEMRSMFVPQCDIDDGKYEGMEHIYPINTTYKTDEWKERYRMALFEILLPYCKEFNDNKVGNESFTIDNYIKNCPDVIEKTNEYIASVDILNDFIHEYMVYDTMKAVSVKSLYKEFKDSIIFMELEKKAKDALNRESAFKEAISKHPRMMKDYKEVLYGNVISNKKYADALGVTKNARNIIINWRLRTPEEIEGVNYQDGIAEVA
jgi:phage/plasmid-associated DNA primase